MGQDGLSVTDGIRTSYGTFLKRASDPTLERVERRLAAWTHLPAEHQEDLQACACSLCRQPFHMFAPDFMKYLHAQRLLDEPVTCYGRGMRAPRMGFLGFEATGRHVGNCRMCDHGRSQQGGACLLPCRC